MADKFQNKYRISSARLQNWDYGRNAAYFVTICTKNREHFFGNIIDGEMHLSAIGKIAEAEWIKTFEIRYDMNLTMGEFVVMPNHFHAIVIIGKNQYNTIKTNTPIVSNVETQCIASLPPTPPTPLPPPPTPPTPPTALPPPPSVQTDSNSAKNQFGPQRKNLASVIRGFKIGVTTNARKTHPGFAWQPRFHDHIIRNAKSHERIRNYIINNPQNWGKDKFNKK